MFTHFSDLGGADFFIYAFFIFTVKTRGGEGSCCAFVGIAGVDGAFVRRGYCFKRSKTLVKGGK